MTENIKDLMNEFHNTLASRFSFIDQKLDMFETRMNKIEETMLKLTWDLEEHRGRPEE